MQNHSNGHPEGTGHWVHSYLPLVLIVFLALALGLYRLESKSLWHDEFGTLTNAGWNGGWLDAIRNPLTVPTLPKPPLPFLITRISLALDRSVFAARLPSVVFATLTIPVLYLVGRALFNRRVGLLAALLLAIAPLHIRYAQEARMYSMLAFFSLLSLYLFWRAIRVQQLRWWLGFSLVTVLNLYTHQLAVLVFGVTILFGSWLLLRTRVRPDLKAEFPFRAWHFVGAAGLSILLYLPMAPFLLEGIMSPEGLGGTPGMVYGEMRWDLNSLVAGFGLFGGGSGVGMVVYAVFFIVALEVLLVWSYTARGGLSAEPRGPGANASLPPNRWGIADCRIRNCYVLLLLLAWLVLPLVILLSVPAGHGVRIRYLLFLLPVYLLLVAFGMCVAIRWLGSRLANLRNPAFSPRWAQVLVAVLLLGMLVAIGRSPVAAYYAEEKQMWRDGFALVQNSAQPGEVMFVSRLHHQTGAAFYGSVRMDDSELVTIESIRILPKEPGEELLPAETDRGWLVVPVREQYLPGGALDAKLRPHYRLGEPVILSPENVPQYSQVIGPISYRSLAVMEILRLRPPSVHFAADDESIHSGECTWLRWKVENVREVYLEGDGVVGRGEREVCPTESTAFELEVIHADGASTLETIEIEVVSP